jgi:tetratricopeptide (TPR) repeat protein
MIVKDEEASLPKCLESVRGVVDEIVILDTGSQDQTIAIAQQFGAQVHSLPWPNDFSVARNAALKHVHGDWVLVLDADEVLLPQIVPLIRQAIQSEQLLLVNLLRQEVGAAQTPYSLVSRLFRNHPQIYFSRPYHELVDESVVQIQQQQPHWQVGYIPQAAILHYGYQPQAIASRNKNQRARTLMAEFLKTHPNDAYICAKLGALYLHEGQVQQSLETLQQGLRATPTEASVLYELHYHLGMAEAQRGQVSEAVAQFQLAIQQAIPDLLKLGAYNNWGSLLQDLGQFTAAKNLFEHVVMLDPNFAIGHFNLGIALRALGNLAGAIASYQRALQLQPDYAEAHQNLGVALLKLGRVPESLAAFQQAIALLEVSNPQSAQQLRQGLAEMGLLL